MTTTCRHVLCIGALAAFAFIHFPANAQSDSSAPPSSSEPDDGLMARQARSPWLLVPLVSSGPKLGTSLGLMGGYIHRFDDQSPASLVAVQGKWSNTDSSTVGLGGKLYFNQDRDRAVFGIVGGKVTNDYLDFLGTGQQVRTNETLRGYFLRYQHAMYPHLYVGVQAVRNNYGVDGIDPTSDQILDQAGLTGVDAGGVGIAITWDSRDNQNNPTAGTLAQLNNIAYRDRFGGDVSYDVYNLDWRYYLSTSENNVLAFHGGGRWTHDAPASRESTVELRGYTRGQYLGKNQLFFEAENRYTFLPRVGAKVFAGVTCLYGNGKSCGGDQVYPMAGAGLFYVLKPKENMLVSVEYAQGKGDNHGFYIRFGNSF
ncbi:BamA/TamA family outer membrane protein [Variovorax robiniae]|uniref:BamA/TamA family outer membrane protein n=1 Tax=Variovorax robiniae TaxID=1836199 RepID=A0ABU8XB21_9BURK